MGYRILVADDEAEIRDLLRLYLEKEGYEIIEAADGEETINILREDHVDMLLLDIMMPKMDGFHVLKMLRQNNNMPVMILSARTGDADKILGLDLGADDYISKPFNPLEAVARVNSNMRRFYSLGSGVNNASDSDDAAIAEPIQVNELKLDLNSCMLWCSDREIELTSTEFKIMKMFMENPGRIFTKQQIFEYGWGEDYIVADNNIMVCISKLRSKLCPDDSGRYIKTIRGLGYRLTV